MGSPQSFNAAVPEREATGSTVGYGASDGQELQQYGMEAQPLRTLGFQDLDDLGHLHCRRWKKQVTV